MIYISEFFLFEPWKKYKLNISEVIEKKNQDANKDSVLIQIQTFQHTSVR